jgi:hypothetical protein
MGKSIGAIKMSLPCINLLLEHGVIMVLGILSMQCMATPSVKKPNKFKFDG